MRLRIKAGVYHVWKMSCVSEPKGIKWKDRKAGFISNEQGQISRLGEFKEKEGR
jgi:hypothetical protein